MGAMSIVELGVAEADFNIGYAGVVGGAVDDRTVLGANGNGVGIADRIAEEVGRRLLVISLGAEGSKGAMQLGGHGVEENGGGLGCGYGRCRDREGAYGLGADETAIEGERWIWHGTGVLT